MTPDRVGRGHAGRLVYGLRQSGPWATSAVAVLSLCCGGKRAVTAISEFAPIVQSAGYLSAGVYLFDFNAAFAERADRIAGTSSPWGLKRSGSAGLSSFGRSGRSDHRSSAPPSANQRFPDAPRASRIRSDDAVLSIDHLLSSVMASLVRSACR
ncbi:MAG: hypothetical protein IPI82_15625 [Candidatus Microthrix sp.]|nr:hypothetical protein [Candidatus Microthrix sp.]MBK7323822.1 hypothetical protein [Candidatus Microthrix sp.]